MSAPGPGDDVIECQTYTHARRFPLVIGQIGGFHLPVPWTPAQLIAGIATFVVLLYTRRLWALFGSVGNLVLVLGLPLLVGWLIRHLKIEGRTTLRAAGGYGRYLSRSRTGKLHGRPVAHRAPRWHRAARVFVTQSLPTRATFPPPWKPQAHAAPVRSRRR